MYGASGVGKRRIYVWPATIDRVIDGDTVMVMVDQGADDFRKLRIRVRGIDCPESNTAEGKAAQAATELLCPVGSEVTVISYEWQKTFNRSVGDVTLGDGRDLSRELVAAGHAKPSPGPK